MNKDKVAGAIKETGGHIRKELNHLVGSEKGEFLGAKDEAEGKLQKKFGEFKDGLKGN